MAAKSGSGSAPRLRLRRRAAAAAAAASRPSSQSATSGQFKPGGFGGFQILGNRALADGAAQRDLTLRQPERMKSENFFDLAHGQPLLRQPVSSTSQWRPIGPLVCPARFVKMALEFDSGDGDQHSGHRPISDRHQPGIVIAIIPES